MLDGRNSATIYFIYLFFCMKIYLISQRREIRELFLQFKMAAMQIFYKKSIKNRNLVAIQQVFIFDSLSVDSRCQLLQDTCRFVQFISEFKRRHLTSKSNTFFLFSARLSHFQVDEEKKRERAILKDSMFSRQNRLS